MSEKISRRDFLKETGAVVGGVALAVWLGWGGLDWLIDQMSGIGYEGREFEPIPEGCEVVGKHDHVWVWTHSYYGLIHNTSYSHELGFPEYLVSLQRLKKALDETDELVIDWEEKAVFQQGKYFSNYSLPECSLRVATLPYSGDMADFVRMPEQVLKQEQTNIFNILKTAGVKEAWFIGSEPGGCVSEAAEYFVKHDIAIRGVKGLLFPPDDQRQLARVLYTNQVDPVAYFKLIE